MKPMRITILGAGPGGLYAALLLKRANPDHEVSVIERNPADATFGFGVVLSDRTLGNFRTADPDSYASISAHQATWTAIEIIHKDRHVTCDGHTYSGIARRKLLSLLQGRCKELGVKIRFQTEVTSLDTLGDCDLLIAADGVNSLARRTHADAFGTQIEQGHSKYIWLGVGWVPKAFTFLFVPTKHGLFQAHIYPYDKQTSTCIVMCRDETWQRAGLDRLDEADSVRFCQDLLRPYVPGQFLANRSLWSTFQTVKNERWSHGNLVLLGDAAHTAHWSIGSGTKLAMEDAIALVGALEREDSLPEALAAYEQERRPIVERLQAAARVSELACENAEESLHLSPIPFAFHLLTRSGRLDYAELRKRDPAFIQRVDRWYSDWVRVELTSPALTPLEHGDLRIPNRLVLQVKLSEVVASCKAFASSFNLKPGLLLLTNIPPARAEDPELLNLCQEVWDELGSAVGLLLPADDAESAQRIQVLAPYYSWPLKTSPVPAADLNEANTLVAAARAELCLMRLP